MIKSSYTPYGWPPATERNFAMSVTRIYQSSLIMSALLSSGGLNAADVSVGAYAVANHSSCGAGNIPGTIAELDKFFDDQNFGSHFHKNFYWKDARVKNSEWIKDGDYRASSETNLGFDGSDASVLTYIASHGVTSGGIYKALTGSRNFGGCYIPTTSLELGNNLSRYTILSTCQGLKIGNGDNPTAAGENPSRTWKNAAKGVNCIFGYSNNMADADQYGEYLLNNIQDGQTPLSKAFMDASESVSPDNIPAVMCYGASEQDAAEYLATNTQFETESRANAASSWTYRIVNSRESSRGLSAKIPAAIRVNPAEINIEKVASVFLGSGLKQIKSVKRKVFASSAGRVSYQKDTGTLIIKNNLIDELKSEAVPSASEAEQIAAHALKVSGLAKSSGNLTVTASAEDVIGSESGAQKVVARKITFKQILAGYTTLSQQGSIDVSVGPGGTITEIKASILSLDKAFKAASVPTDLSGRMEDIEATAIQSVATKSPGGSYKVTGYRLGYDAGNFHKSRPMAPAVIAVTVEAAHGEFTRRFIEKINL